MKIINLEQGTDEWKKYRLGGVGASDIPIIMGTLPTKYKTKYELWQIKCGQKAEDAPNKAMYHGMQYENAAREWCSKAMELDLKPLCIQDEEVDYFRASLDGYDADQKIVVEIKCPMNTQTLDDALECGAVHSYWIDQTLWQMGLAGTEEGYIALWDHRDHTCCVIRVHWDEKRYKKMRFEAKVFWDNVKCGIPPELNEKDYKEIHNTELEHLLFEYGQYDNEEKAAKKRKEALKERILEFGDGGNFTCSGHKVYKRAGNVTYDTKAMVKDGINVDKYKKVGKSYYVVKIENNKIISFEELSD